jgi:5-hydroxyisourate hydrolase
MKSPITTHILDTSIGRPARDLAVTLAYEEKSGFEEIGHGLSDEQGCVHDLYPVRPLELGTYRLRFATEAYFRGLGVRCFYPYLDVVFVVDVPSEHYHVPLLLSPFGYSTYRGS